jgi:hypothetical protein
LSGIHNRGTFVSPLQGLPAHPASAARKKTPLGPPCYLSHSTEKPRGVSRLNFENSPARLYHLSRSQCEPEIFWFQPSLPGQNTAVGKQTSDQSAIFNIRWWAAVA